MSFDPEGRLGEPRDDPFEAPAFFGLDAGEGSDAWIAEELRRRAHRMRIVALGVAVVLVVTGPAVYLLFGDRRSPVTYRIPTAQAVVFPPDLLQGEDRLRCGGGDQIAAPVEVDPSDVVTRGPAGDTSWRFQRRPDGSLEVACFAPAGATGVATL